MNDWGITWHNINFKLVKVANERDQTLYIKRLRWLKEDQQQQLGKLQGKHAAEIMRLAKARVDMWTAFLKKLAAMTKALEAQSKDLEAKPAPITIETKQLKELKARWDNGAFDDQIKTCSSGTIAALNIWLRDTEQKRREWITTRRAAELQAEHVKEKMEQAAAGDGDDGKPDVQDAAPVEDGFPLDAEWVNMAEAMIGDSGVNAI